MRAVLDAISPGDRVFIGGAAGEPTALLSAWNEDPDRTRDLSIVATAVPGLNRIDLSRWHPSSRVTGFMMQAGFRAEQRVGRFRHLPISYSAAQKWIASEPAFDVCVVQVSAPNAAGQFSLGPAVEFFPTLLPRANKTVAIVNARTPFIPGSPSISRASFSASAEVDTPLPSYDPGAADEVSLKISQALGGFIRDGAAIQVGIGRVPARLLAMLVDRRKLRLVTGMYGDGVEKLAAAGALDSSFEHRACLAIGTPALLDALRELPALQLKGCEVTHDLPTLARTNGLVAVNSALEVDLWGQCNLEIADGRAISGAGGAPDFARAAKVAPNGLSMVGLQATAADGKVSRIVPRLGGPGLASLARTDVDIVATEFGVADLRGLSVHERAEALICIAAPTFQSELGAAWKTVSATL